MKTNHKPESTTAAGFSIAPAFAALDQPDNEKKLLVADARRQKLPGAAAASRWSLDTLREKLGRGRRPAPFSKRDFRKADAPVAEAPAPVVAEAPAPVIAEAPAPVVAETPAPVVAETPAPVVAETPAPVLAEAPAPVVAETPAPVVAEAPAPVVAEAPARKPRIEVGDRLTAKVIEKLPFGVVVSLPGYKCSALLHVSELAGAGFAARTRRLAALKGGDELEVEVIRLSERKPQGAPTGAEAEEKPNKQLNKGGKRRGKGKGNNKGARIRVSEKRVQYPRLLSDLAPSTPVKVTVCQLLPFGVIVTIKDGLAAGCDALIHVSQFPGRKGTLPRNGQPGKPSERDAALSRTKLGAELDAEVLSVRTNEQRKGDLDIRLTLRGPEERAFLGKFSPGSQLTGRVTGFEADTYEIAFGRVRGFLHAAKLGHAAPESVRVGSNVRVRVESFDEKRMVCQLTRRGL